MYYEWLIGRRDAQGERDQMHLAAIREARIATEHRRAMAEAGTTAAPARRVALATAGTESSVDLGSRVDLCASCV
ncbi:MAG: hypothetical protein A2V84_04115 [Chloroflexi bacterium RBG_16_70_13]|nr:MAG: hypothetical protein A2V84_04115 [Chloroflexi bacterium RBG_16_70_13]